MIETLLILAALIGCFWHYNREAAKHMLLVILLGGLEFCAFGMARTLLIHLLR